MKNEEKNFSQVLADRRIEYERLRAETKKIQNNNFDNLENSIKGVINKCSNQTLKKIWMF